MWRIGECKFCGQSGQIEADSDVEQSIIDQKVTDACRCDKAIRIRNRNIMHDQAIEVINNLCEGPDAAAGEVIKAALDGMYEGTIQRITIKTSDSRSYRLKWNTREECVDITRNDTQQMTTSVG